MVRVLPKSTEHSNPSYSVSCDESYLEGLKVETFSSVGHAGLV